MSPEIVVAAIAALSMAASRTILRNPLQPPETKKQSPTGRRNCFRPSARRPSPFAAEPLSVRNGRVAADVLTSPKTPAATETDATEKMSPPRRAAPPAAERHCRRLERERDGQRRCLRIRVPLGYCSISPTSSSPR